MASILTNNSAMVALQTLRGINSNLADVQSQISTGKRVATAKDNSAVWAISKVMESDVQGFKAISESLALGESTVAVARNAAESVTDLLTEMKGRIVAAQEQNVSRPKLQADIVALRDQVESVVQSAQFNGLNLINDDSVATVDVLSSLNRQSDGTVDAANITVDKVDLSASGGAMASIGALDVSSATGTALADALTTVETAIGVAVDAAAAFGSVQGRIETQADFISKLTDNFKTGIGSLVDADLEAASARLQALQTQQQLGVQSLSIANQAPQSILSLFR